MIKVPVILVLIFFTIQSAAASEPAWSVNAYTEGVSKYLWRGWNLHDNFAVQPGLELGIGNGAIGVWGSYNLVEEETKGLAEIE